MKGVLKGIVLFLAAVVIIIVGGAYLIPPKVVVERTVVIAYPPERVYAIVGSMKRFNDWSPWFGLDPKAEYSFEGPEQGVGQKMTWKSADPNVGNGSQTVTEAVENQKVVTDLDFGAMGKAQASMDLSPVDGGTLVKWGFRSDVNGIMERWMSLMFDKWIGADYVKGLNALKALVEKEAAPAAG
jgi:uncharacterized protein YndB with AHSA1/START domain